MPNIKKFNEVQPARATRLINAAKTSALLAPFALTGAFAEGAAEQLSAGAKSQMEGAIPLIIGLLLVGIGLTVAFFVNKNVKKGVKSAG